MDRKRVIKIILLFAISVLAYTVLDMWDRDFRWKFLVCPGIQSSMMPFRVIIFSLILIVWVLPIILFKASEDIFAKIFCGFLAMPIVAWYGFWALLSNVFEPDYLLLLLIFPILFYTFFTILFWRILFEKTIIPDEMKGSMRKRVKYLILLFVVTIIAYVILDIKLGETFQFIMTAQLIPNDRFAFDFRPRNISRSIELVLLRTAVFTFILCFWSYLIFLFTIVRKKVFKAASCLLAAINVWWFAGWAWKAVNGWIPHYADSVLFEEPTKPYVFAGVAVFYTVFTVVLFMILNTRKQSSIEIADC